MFLALVMQAWPSCSYSTTPDTQTLALSLPPLKPSVSFPLWALAHSVHLHLLSWPPELGNSGSLVSKNKTSFNLLKPRDSWGASRTEGAAGCAGLRRVLAQELLALSQLAAFLLGQSLGRPVARPSHSRFNSHKRAAGFLGTGQMHSYDWIGQLWLWWGRELFVGRAYNNPCPKLRVTPACTAQSSLYKLCVSLRKC